MIDSFQGQEQSVACPLVHCLSARSIAKEASVVGWYSLLTRRSLRCCLGWKSSHRMAQH